MSFLKRLVDTKRPASMKEKGNYERYVNIIRQYFNEGGSHERRVWESKKEKLKVTSLEWFIFN